MRAGTVVVVVSGRVLRLVVASVRARRLVGSGLLRRTDPCTPLACSAPELLASLGSSKQSAMRWWTRASKVARRIRRKLRPMTALAIVVGIVGITTITIGRDSPINRMLPAIVAVVSVADSVATNIITTRIGVGAR